MSAIDTPTQYAVVDDEDVVDAIEQGGSPADPNVQAGTSGKKADAAEGEEPEAGGETEGAEPKVEDGAGKVPDAWQEEKQALVRERDEMRQLIAEVQAVARTNPEVAKAFGFQSNGGATGGESWRKESDEALAGLTPDAAEAMRRVLAPYAAQIERMAKQLGDVGATASRTAQTTAATTFRNALVEAKVPVDNPAFQKILRDLRRDPDFQSGEARGASLAIRAARDAWFASTGRAAINGAAKVQLEAAKGGKTGGRTASASMAEKIVTLSGEYDPMKSYQLRLEAQKAGRAPPKIVWSNKADPSDE